MSPLKLHLSQDSKGWFKPLFYFLGYIITCDDYNRYNLQDEGQLHVEMNF